MAIVRTFHTIRNLNLFKLSFFQEEKKLLGRWSSPKDIKELEKKVYLANYDHCGPCGYHNPKYYEKK